MSGSLGQCLGLVTVRVTAFDDEAFEAAGSVTFFATGLTTFRAGALVAFFATFFALVPIVGRAGAAARGGATPGRCTTVPSFFTVFGAWVAGAAPGRSRAAPGGSQSAAAWPLHPERTRN